jgi:UDP-GlcNAc:undecaprenyl-phosphate/decaprenyl-phosphate GlcNAc-1-phosphate transferase
LNIYAIPEGASYLFSLIVVLGITNAFNLIDGLDGLAGSLSLFASLLYALLFYVLVGNENSQYVLVCLSLAGALIGFLKYNFHKAEIFMGDTGSLISGFIIAFLAIKIVMIPTEFNLAKYSLPALAIAPIIIPIADTLRVFLIRVLASSSPFSPDNNHLHHRLLELGFSQLNIVGLALMYTFLNAFLVMWLSTILGSTILLLGMAVMIVFSMAIIEILYKKRSKSCVKSI